MPKIFLIKNRLHQQQLRLLESQNLLNKDDDRLVPPLSPNGRDEEDYRSRREEEEQEGRSFKLTFYLSFWLESFVFIYNLKANGIFFLIRQNYVIENLTHEIMKVLIV